MNRVYLLQRRLLALIDRQDPQAQRDEPLDFERLHLASCARVAWLLALERGVDPELAAAAAAMHDIGRIVTGRQSGHAEAGYEPARAFLKESGLFGDDEIEIIATAVKNHSSKTVVGTPVEEIVKDADVIDCYHYGFPFDRPEKEERYNKWLGSRPK
ncbi:MAG: HD domain-containing protein [Clostridiales bacterium]|nr:HD domain-containing protein [Clostridiales bacterium]